MPSDPGDTSDDTPHETAGGAADPTTTGLTAPDASTAGAATGDAATPDAADGPAYVDALTELEAILSELEADDPDVDVLTVRVRRAAELIQLCRGRIRTARDEVERVVAELDTPDAPSNGGPG